MDKMPKKTYVTLYSKIICNFASISILSATVLISGLLGVALVLYFFNLLLGG